VLQGSGQIGLPVRNFILGALVKAFLTWLWTGTYGINGAAYATAIGFGLAAALNLYQVERIVGRTFKLGNMLIRPLVAALAMAGVIWVGQPIVLTWTGSLKLATMALIPVGGIIYGLVLLAVRGIDRQEIEYLPRLGKPLATVLTRLRLLR